MILQPRTAGHVAGPQSLGALATAQPPTAARPIIGVVVAVAGYAVTLRTTSEMEVVVDIEDCVDLWHREPSLP